MSLIAPGDLIVDSWVNFRRNFRTYAEIVVWFALLGVIRWAITAFSRSFVDDDGMRIVMNLLLSLPVFFMYALLSVAAIDLVGAHVNKRKMELRDAINQAFHKVFSSIWVGILAGFGVLVGFLFLIIPGVILTVRWKFAQDFVVIDGLRGGDAIRASSAVVAGRWWATLGRLVLPAIFFSAAGAFTVSMVNLLFGALLGDPGLFFGQYSATQSLPNSHAIITSIIPQVVNGFILPLYLGAELLLWFDLKRTA